MSVVMLEIAKSIDNVKSYLEGKETNWYDIPRGVTGSIVNPINGSTTDLSVKDLLYFVKGTEPNYVRN